MKPARCGKAVAAVVVVVTVATGVDAAAVVEAGAATIDNHVHAVR
jgi:hypothetical protein